MICFVTIHLMVVSQSIFGPGHLVCSLASSLRWLPVCCAQPWIYCRHSRQRILHEACDDHGPPFHIQASSWLCSCNMACRCRRVLDLYRAHDEPLCILAILPSHHLCISLNPRSCPSSSLALLINIDVKKSLYSPRVSTNPVSC